MQRDSSDQAHVQGFKVDTIHQDNEFEGEESFSQTRQIQTHISDYSWTTISGS